MADLSKLRFNGTDYNVKDASAPKRKFDNTYAKTGNLPITSDDTPQTAIGKLEKALDSNQANILSVKQKVGVNLLHTGEFSGGASDTGIDFTTEDGIISVKGTKTIADSYRNIACDDFKASSQYYVVATTTGSPRVSIRVFGYKNGSYTQLIDTAGTAAFNTSDYEWLLTRVVVGGSINDTVNASISAMIISKEDYEAGLTAFQQYGAPNSDLTRLESEDRSALAEVVDSGAKNKVDIANVTTTGSSYVFNNVAISLLAGSYVFSYTSNQSISGNAELILRNGTTVLADHIVTSTSGRIEIPFTLASAANNITLYSVRAGTYSDFMICTLADWKVSQKYVPRVKSNHELTQYTEGCTLDTTAKSTGSLDDITSNTFAVYNVSVTGKPVDTDGNTSAFTGLCKTDVYSSSEAMQTLTRLSNGHTWIRTKTAGIWNSWILLGGVSNWRNEVTFTAANTYQKVASISVPVGVYMRINVGQFYSNGIPTGIIISKANDVASISAGNTFAKAEQSASGSEYQMASFSTSTYFFNTQNAFTMNIFCRCSNATKNTVFVTAEILN